MSKEMAVIASGIWVAVIPYLGIPGSWRTILTMLTGLVIVSLGFFLRAEVLSRGSHRSRHHLFVENLPAGQASSANADSQYANEHKEGIHSLN